MQDNQKYKFNRNPTTFDVTSSMRERNDFNEFSDENNISLQRALDMINKLTSICAKLSDINPDTVSDATDFLNDQSLFDLFVQRVENGMEIKKAAKYEDSQQKQRITPDTYFFIKQVQNQIVTLKNTLHNDHVQLLQSLFAEPESESFLSDHSSIMDQ